jgi:ParB family transcriptional regulator, chromosome partitioning protein
MAKKVLGKGLGALIKKQSEAPAPNPSTQPVREVDGQAVIEASILDVVSSPFQPRKIFNDSHIEELADSIQHHGIIQPLIVRSVNGRYELIAGERRWRAATHLGLEKVPILVKEASDQEVLEIALIENLQRADLNAIEEAAGYNRLAKEFGLKQEQIAKQVGKSRVAVANSIRLLDLHEDVQDLLAEKKIAVGHAKAILGLKDKESQGSVALQVIQNKLTVRAAERLVQGLNSGAAEEKEKSKQTAQQSEALLKLQEQLRKEFATNVSISQNGKKGKIEIEYYSKADLTRVLELLGITVEEEKNFS